MAAGDEFLFETAKRAVLSGLGDPEAIVYRQRVLADCLEHPEASGSSIALAIEALAERTGGWRRFGTATARHDPAPVGPGPQAVRGRTQATAADRGRACARLPLGGVHALLRDASRRARRRLPRVGRAASARARVQARHAGKRRARQGRQGSRYMFHEPRRAALDGAAAVGNRPPGYSFGSILATRAASGRWRRSRPKGSTRRRRARAVRRSRQELLRHAPPRARVLPRLPEPARAPEREGRADVLPEPLADGRLALAARGPLRRLPDAPPRGPSRRQRRERRWQVAGDDHRRQPGRQVDPVAQPRPRPADDAERHVRRRANRSAPVSAPACSRTTSAKRTPRWRAASSTRSSPG